MDKESSLAKSLNKLQELSSSGEVAKVKRPIKVKEQAWSSNEKATNLLGDLLGQATSRASEEAERKRIELELAEEEAKKAAEYEEELKKLEAEQALLEEKRLHEEKQIRHTQMMAAIEREKKIEAGEIDLEEEARLKREEEERIRKEQEAIAAKEAERKRAKELLEEQKKQMEELTEQQIVMAEKKKKSQTGLIVASIAAVLMIGIAFAAWWLLKPEPIDIYALDENYPSSSLLFLQDEEAVASVSSNIVKQAEPVVVKPEASRPARRRPAAPAKEEKGGSLLGGSRGGLLGGGRGGGL